MTATLSAPPDASALAAEVRQLARHAHRLLNDPHTPPHQLAELARRVSQLRDQVNERDDRPIARWLDGLERRLPVSTYEF